MRVHPLGLLVALASAAPAFAEPPPPAGRTLVDLYADAGVGVGWLYQRPDERDAEFHASRPGFLLHLSVGAVLLQPRLWSIRLGGTALMCGCRDGAVGWAGAEGEIATAVGRDRQLGVRLSVAGTGWRPFSGAGYVGALGVRLRGTDTFLGVDAVGMTHPDGYGLGVLAIAGVGGRTGKIVVGGLAALLLGVIVTRWDEGGA